MTGNHGSFATVVSCMDGRVQETVLRKVKELTNATYVDNITYAGPDGALVNGGENVDDHFRRHIGISVSKHGSANVYIFGHDDCAGNPVDRESHQVHEKLAAEKIRGWFPEVKVFYGHVENRDGEWVITVSQG